MEHKEKKRRRKMGEKASFVNRGKRDCSGVARMPGERN
jgi:hypothetical protein